MHIWYTRQTNLPPYCNWCSTCLNKQCAATSTAMSSEVTALGKSSTFDKGEVEELSLKSLSWEYFISSVSLSLILNNSCTAALVWLKWKASLHKSLLVLQSSDSPTLKPYNFKVIWYWLSERWGFWSRNCRSKDFDLPSTSRDSFRFPKCICPDLLKFARYLSSFTAREGFVCNRW